MQQMKDEDKMRKRRHKPTATYKVTAASAAAPEQGDHCPSCYTAAILLPADTLPPSEWNLTRTAEEEQRHESTISAKLISKSC